MFSDGRQMPFLSYQYRLYSGAIIHNSNNHLKLVRLVRGIGTRHENKKTPIDSYITSGTICENP